LIERAFAHIAIFFFAQKNWPKPEFFSSKPRLKYKRNEEGKFKDKIMKKLLVMICMMFGVAFAAKATGERSSKAIASARAQHLSDQMIRDLRLNNFQAKKVREINQQVAEQVTAIEQQYANNAKQIEELCRNVYSERDLFLENVLSTVQYNDYFGDRKVYREVDQKFIASLNNQTPGSIAEAGIANDNATASSVN